MIPSIPTTYGGVRFRSKLEARWAAFFTQLEWPWSYERVCLPSRTCSFGYTPDFMIDWHEPLLIEVKPAPPNAMTTIDESWLAERERLAAAATPGPWTPFFAQPGLMEIEEAEWKDADLSFIADARTSVPLLIEEVRRLRSFIAKQFGKKP